MDQPTVKLILSRITLYVLLLLGWGVASAGIYKWVDGNGRVHYGEQPAGPAAEEITIPQSDTQKGSGSEVNDRIKDMQNWNDARQLEREKKKQEELKRLEEKKKTEKKCTELRADLRDLEEGGVHWYDLDDKGERHYLNDKEVATRTNGLRKTIADHCN